MLPKRVTSGLDSFLLVSFITCSFRPIQKMFVIEERFVGIECVLVVVDRPFGVRYCCFSGTKSLLWVGCLLMLLWEVLSCELKPFSVSVTVNSWSGVTHFSFSYFLYCELTSTVHFLLPK